MIRTPYPELQHDYTDQLAAFREWNRGIQRSIDAYHDCPFIDLRYRTKGRK